MEGLPGPDTATETRLPEEEMPPLSNFDAPVRHHLQSAEKPSMLHLLLKLPHALATTILKHLDVASVGQLTCASRALCEATSDPEVRTFRVL